MSKPEVLETPTGYESAEVARFLWQMDDQSARLTADTSNATPEELVWQPDPGFNTIGMLLAHIAIVEVFWTQIVLEERTFDAMEILGIDADADGMPLAPTGLPPAALSGKDWAYFSDLLRRAREHLKDVARGLSDADLPRTVTRTRKNGAQDTFDKGWALYHMLEHEAAHYGQIMLVRHLYRVAGGGSNQPAL